MPRRSRSTGVGRGNGPGSAATQQKPGMPSINPHGRPKKYTPPPPSTMAELVAREVAKRVSGVENGTPFDRPMVEVMVAHLMADYPKMSPAMKLRTVEWVERLVPDLRPPVVHQSHDAAVSALVNRLAEEYRREHPEDVKFAMECDEHDRRVQAAG